MSEEVSMPAPVSLGRGSVKRGPARPSQFGYQENTKVRHWERKEVKLGTMTLKQWVLEGNQQAGLHSESRKEHRDRMESIRKLQTNQPMTRRMRTHLSDVTSGVPELEVGLTAGDAAALFATPQAKRKRESSNIDTDREGEEETEEGDVDMSEATSMMDDEEAEEQRENGVKEEEGEEVKEEDNGGLLRGDAAASEREKVQAKEGERH